MLNGKRILITGATGFIGANLVHRFLNTGAEIHIFTRPTSNKWRIRNILNDVNEHSVDLLNYDKLKTVISSIKPHIIFHTAIYGGYAFQNDTNKILETNFMGTVNLINACTKIEFELFVNTGSSSEYGVKSKPMRESDLLCPINDYGVSKAAATLYCQSVARKEKREIVTLRLFSPYGYYEEPTRLIPSVIKSCLLGENPKLTSPDSVRDFNFVEDVIDAYMQVLGIPDISGEIFNIACGEQHSVDEVVNLIIKLTGNKVIPQWGNLSNPRTEPSMWVADISKAKKTLNWQPRYSLEEGLKKTVNWFEKNIGDSVT